MQLLRPHKIGADRLEIFPGNARIHYILNGRLDVLFVIALADDTDAMFGYELSKPAICRRVSKNGTLRLDIMWRVSSEWYGESTRSGLLVDTWHKECGTNQAPV